MVFFTDVSDIEKLYPGLMKATIEWFKIYKIPDGKPENQFAFNGEAKPRDFALHIIDEVNQHWQNLIKREAPAGGIVWFVNSPNILFEQKYSFQTLNYTNKNNLHSTNTTVIGSPFKITPEAAEEILEKAPGTLEAQAIDPIGKLQIFVCLCQLFN